MYVGKENIKSNCVLVNIEIVRRSLYSIYKYIVCRARYTGFTTGIGTRIKRFTRYRRGRNSPRIGFRTSFRLNTRILIKPYRACVLFYNNNGKYIFLQKNQWKIFVILHRAYAQNFWSILFQHWFQIENNRSSNFPQNM